MEGLSFSELWDNSKAFRGIFAYRGIIKNAKEKGLAEMCWIERHPKTEWCFCGVDGCNRLVHVGEKCSDHSIDIDGRLPEWKWRDGHLYCLRRNYGCGKPTYIRYDRYAWTESFGSIPSGFVIRYLDRNPLNYSLRNLVLLSSLSASIVDEGIISPAQGVELDSVIPDCFLVSPTKKRTRSIWVYNIRQLARAFGIKTSRLRQYEKEHAVDLSNFISVMKFYRYFFNEKDGHIRITDIAEAAGVTPRQVRRVVCNGDLNVWSLSEIVQYCSNERTKGRRKKEWSYNVESIANECGLSIGAVYLAIRDGRLDPGKFSSVLEFCKRKQKKCRIDNGR
jgi:hypothetical protein